MTALLNSLIDGRDMKFIPMKPGSIGLRVDEVGFTASTDDLNKLRKQIYDLRMLSLRLPLIARENSAEGVPSLIGSHVAYSLMHDHPEAEVPLIVIPSQDLTEENLKFLTKLDRVISTAVINAFSEATGPSRPIRAREKRADQNQRCVICHHPGKDYVLRVPKNWKTLLSQNQGGHVSCKKCGIQIFLNAEELREFNSGTLTTWHFIRLKYGTNGRVEECPLCAAAKKQFGIILQRFRSGHLIGEVCRNRLKDPLECGFERIYDGVIWLSMI